ELDRPIIAHFERSARQHRDRIDVTDADTSLSFSELWDGVSGLAEIIAVKTKPGDLIGIALAACSKFPVAVLACLATGRPFIALDPQYARDWFARVLDQARPALSLGPEEILNVVETIAPTMRVIQVTGLPQPARKTWQPTEFDVDQPACVLFTSGSTG